MRSVPHLSLSAPSQSAFSIGCSSRGGPGSSTITCLADVRDTVRARCRSGCRARPRRRARCAWRRLMSGICSPRRANRAAMCSTIVRLLDQRPSDHRRHRVTREIVVGRSQPAGQHHEIDARQCLPAQLGQSDPGRRRRPLSRGARCRSPDSRSAMNSELVSSLRRAEQLRADGDDFRRAQRSSTSGVHRRNPLSLLPLPCRRHSFGNC